MILSRFYYKSSKNQQKMYKINKKVNNKNKKYFKQFSIGHVYFGFTLSPTLSVSIFAFIFFLSISHTHTYTLSLFHSLSQFPFLHMSLFIFCLFDFKSPSNTHTHSLSLSLSLSLYLSLNFILEQIGTHLLTQKRLSVDNVTNISLEYFFFNTTIEKKATANIFMSDYEHSTFGLKST